MTQMLPEVTQIYQNHHLDSTRWKHYIPRADDIIITTSPKSGTTWMQLILKHLVIGDTESGVLGDFSPWFDARWNPLERFIPEIEGQTHRRIIMSHLALDGLPYFPQVKYIVVCRDGRDVFMSLWNHYSHYSDNFYALLNDTPGLVGDPLPRCPNDIHAFWQMWITRGWFEWESEGYPFWGNLHHTQTYWTFRHLPNIMFIHFNNLLANPVHEISRVADFIEAPVTEEQIENIASATSFTNLKRNSEKILGGYTAFQGGSKTFINKGTNGRWRDVLTDAQLELYDAALERLLTPDCRHYLETGKMSY